MEINRYFWTLMNEAGKRNARSSCRLTLSIKTLRPLAPKKRVVYFSIFCPVQICTFLCKGSLSAATSSYENFPVIRSYQGSSITEIVKKVREWVLLYLESQRVRMVCR